MNYSFDDFVDRRNTRSYKWDQNKKRFGQADILPLWVADMDFPSPPAVTEALKKRAELGLYGYAIRTDEYFNAIIQWFRNRHHWEIQRGWITDSPSVVTSLSLAVELFSEPGAPVVIQTPVYYPFYDVIENNGRKVARNSLLLRSGRYEMDYEHLESLFKDGARLMLLCSPHNPGGRVWEREELLRLGELCLKYEVTVISDEIHCDLTFPGHTHVPFASLSSELATITVTCLAATKSFNLPGLQTSFIVASNANLRRRIEHRLITLSLNMAQHFAQDAVEAAYREGAEWLDEMMEYVKGNLEFAIEYLALYLPEVKPLRPEGTYLLWLDCRQLGLDSKGLKELMYSRAKVAFNEGSMFGTEGEGGLRVNLACPRTMVAQALKQFCDAANEGK
ncbi:MalY/PatB family protein [Paenibacillus sp. y28]|uniref:MalY/PatB family protein n=1 Tax=Paenibacillus sp. y28 TaxID=3129110 RepID=UPI003017DA57